MSEATAGILIAGLIAAAALALVAWPVLLRQRRTRGGAGPSAEGIEERIAEYVAALEAGTVCTRCLYANWTDAAYCSFCGRSLTARDVATAREAAG